MADGKKSFIAYTDWIQTFDELEDDEAGRLAKHIWRYVNDLNPISDDKLIKMCFIPIKAALKRDLIKYESIIDRNKINGSKGGRPKKPKKPSGLNENQTKPKKPDNDNDNDNDNVKEEYKYNEFYDSELEISEKDQGYETFIKWIFGDNELQRPLVGVLKMREQMNYKQYKTLEVRWQKLKADKNIIEPKIQELLVNMENWVVKENKNYKTTLAGMMLTFLKNNTKPIKSKSW